MWQKKHPRLSQAHGGWFLGAPLLAEKCDLGGIISVFCHWFPWLILAPAGQGGSSSWFKTNYVMMISCRRLWCVWLGEWWEQDKSPNGVGEDTLCGLFYPSVSSRSFPLFSLLTENTFQDSLGMIFVCKDRRFAFVYRAKRHTEHPHETVPHSFIHWVMNLDWVLYYFISGMKSPSLI